MRKTTGQVSCKSLQLPGEENGYDEESLAICKQPPGRQPVTWRKRCVASEKKSEKDENIWKSMHRPSLLWSHLLGCDVAKESLPQSAPMSAK